MASSATRRPSNCASSRSSSLSLGAPRPARQGGWHRRATRRCVVRCSAGAVNGNPTRYMPWCIRGSIIDSSVDSWPPCIDVVEVNTAAGLRSSVPLSQSALVPSRKYFKGRRHVAEPGRAAEEQPVALDEIVVRGVGGPGGGHGRLRWLQSTGVTGGTVRRRAVAPVDRFDARARHGGPARPWRHGGSNRRRGFPPWEDTRLRAKKPLPHGWTRARRADSRRTSLDGTGCACYGPFSFASTRMPSLATSVSCHRSWPCCLGRPVSGCAGAPVQEMSNARQAVRAAERACAGKRARPNSTKRAGC